MTPKAINEFVNLHSNDENAYFPSTHAILSVLVLPGVPNGTPAVTTSLSPTSATPVSRAMREARSTISLKLFTSGVMTPRTA